MAEPSLTEVTLPGPLKGSNVPSEDTSPNGALSVQERFPGGMWKIHILYEGLDLPMQYPQHAQVYPWRISNRPE